MPSYIYLISSLPMLHFGMSPPFSFRKFLQMCRRCIPAEDFRIIESSSLGGEASCSDTLAPAVLKAWRCFDTALRNELVRIRAARRHISPEKHLRRDAGIDTAAARIAIRAYRTPSLIDAERILDEQRWRRLEELARGHYFDLAFLVTYAHKLLILERWDRIGRADSQLILEETLKQNEA